MNKNILTDFFLSAVLALSLSSCRSNDSSDPIVKEEPKLLENYSFQLTGAYPEGVDYDTKNKRFVISSFNKGIVYTLGIDGKTFAPLINDPHLIAALGVYTDEENERIIVVSGDAGASEKSGAGGSTAGQVAYAGVYNAKTGALINNVNLKPLVASGGVFPNDITVDKNGNIYITDSFSPVIYKIDTGYKGSVFVNNSAFSVSPNAFGLNGIVYHKDGYLIAAHTEKAKLFKISIANGEVSEITGVNDAFKAPDGLEWKGNDLVVIENGLAGGKAHVLSSSNNWGSASKVKEVSIGAAEFPTTAYAAYNGTVYVLNSYLGKLLGGDKTHADYQIKGVKL
ncbi:SBBP repeat-containing protein [Chryseobacterium sp. Tr-659]|uniref:SBBP repeat-containing protein n=1 Tax=Chryseobacterium sp. Tr-659 TaxID=2608340 RepID=UPI00142082F8|nr:SBBP repeat-containing protein [Chryseobacterium sp. Tr-659]